MNGPTRLLLPLLALSLLTACDSEEQVFEDSAAYDEEADGETDAFDSDSAETGDYEEAPWAEDGDLASEPGAVGRLFPVNWGLGMNYAGGANGQHWANIFWFNVEHADSEEGFHRIHCAVVRQAISSDLISHVFAG